MTERPAPGDAVVPPMDADALIEVASLPDDQPYAALGVFEVEDQYGERHLVAREGDEWCAHSPEGLGKAVDTAHSALNGGLVEEAGDAAYFLRDFVDTEVEHERNREFLSARAAELVDEWTRPAVLAEAPEPKDPSLVEVAVLAAALERAEKALAPQPAP